MRLYLIQHGLSLPEEVDPQKGLSEEGRAQTLRMVEFLKERNIKVDTIWHSEKLRSIQTAQILAECTPNAEIKKRSDLNPLESVDAFPPEIEVLNKDLMIVGHLPFLQKLASQLLVGSERYGLISFRNSGVVCMEYDEGWKIVWIVTPDLI